MTHIKEDIVQALASINIKAVSCLDIVHTAREMKYDNHIEPKCITDVSIVSIIQKLTDELKGAESQTVLFETGGNDKWGQDRGTYVEYYVRYFLMQNPEKERGQNINDLDAKILCLKQLDRRLSAARDAMISEHSVLYENARTIGLDCSKFLSTHAFKEELQGRTPLKDQIPIKYDQLQALKAAVKAHCDSKLEGTEKLFEILNTLGV